MNFTHAIVRRPGKSIISGLSLTGGACPNYERTLEQHQSYITALETCGVKVEILEAQEEYPDSTFVEDVAVLTPHCAIVTAPGAVSRRDETASINQVLKKYFAEIETIVAPGTLDGGDILQIGNHFYIGQSKRTNQAGAEQLIAILNKYGMSGSTVAVHQFLHLKTGVTAINLTTLLATGEFIDHPKFSDFTIIPVATKEAEAANCITCNDHVIMPKGFPETREKLKSFTSRVIEVDISEFAKIDGGLTCLSLRF